MSKLNPAVKLSRCRSVLSTAKIKKLYFIFLGIRLYIQSVRAVQNGNSSFFEGWGTKSRISLRIFRLFLGHLVCTSPGHMCTWYDSFQVGSRSWSGNYSDIM